MIDEELAERVRVALDGRADEPPRKMFGGLAFMVDGHLAVCVGDGDLLVRTTDVGTHVRADGTGPLTPMVMGGRTSKTWLHVAPEALVADEALQKWVAIGVAVAGSLPPKQPEA